MDKTAVIFPQITLGTTHVTRFKYENGEAKGLRYNVNIPLPFRTGDQIHSNAIDDIVAPIIRQYKPQFTLISAGFDGHYADPVGKFSLSASCYVKSTKSQLTWHLKSAGAD
jgi:acetoin utilization deacetylase AcuC-like enzyme